MIHTTAKVSVKGQTGTYLLGTRWYNY